MVFDPKSLGYELTHTPDPEHLGGVVAASYEVQPVLAGVGHDVLGRLACQEGIQPSRDRLVEVPRRATGDDSDAVHELRAGVPYEGLLPECGGAAPSQFGEWDALLRTPDEPDRSSLELGKRLGLLEAELAADQSVVAHLRMCVERDVVGRERDVRVEEHT